MTGLRLTDEEFVALTGKEASAAVTPYLSSLAEESERSIAVRTAVRGLVARGLIVPAPAPYPFQARADLRRLLAVTEAPDLVLWALRLDGDDRLRARSWYRRADKVVEDREVGLGVHELVLRPARRVSAEVVGFAAPYEGMVRCELILHLPAGRLVMLALLPAGAGVGWAPISLDGELLEPLRTLSRPGLEHLVHGLSCGESLPQRPDGAGGGEG